MIKWIKNLIGYVSKEEKQKHYQDYLDICRKADNESAQFEEDMRIYMHILEVAGRRWVNSKRVRIPGEIYFDLEPTIGTIYTIYDEESAEYKDKNLQDLIDKEFKKRVEQD